MGKPLWHDIDTWLIQRIIEEFPSRVCWRFDVTAQRLAQPESGRFRKPYLENIYLFRAQWPHTIPCDWQKPKQEHVLFVRYVHRRNRTQVKVIVMYMNMIEGVYDHTFQHARNLKCVHHEKQDLKCSFKQFANLTHFYNLNIYLDVSLLVAWWVTQLYYYVRISF